MEPTHLVVVLHGFMGYCNNVEQLAQTVRSCFGAEAFVIVPASFQLLRSQDGIDVIARRVVSQLHDVIGAHPSLTSISLVGYSMGGLIAHFVAGMLFACEPTPFCGLRPLNFVSIACPHLGARLVTDGSCATRLLRHLAKLLGGRSAIQMTCADGDMQLLALMAHRRSAFSRGLAAFARRSLYSNVSGDRTVPFWSSFIAPWSGGAPVAPPVGQGPERRVDILAYPHVEWEDSLGGGGTGSDALNSGAHTRGDGKATGTDASPSPEGQSTVYAASPATTRVTSTLLAPGPPEPGLSLSQRCMLLALVLFALSVLLPLWLTFVLPTLLIAKGCRAIVVSAVPPSPEPPLFDLSDSHTDTSRRDGSDTRVAWSVAGLQQMVRAAEMGCVQEWIASELNTLRWHKVAVHFSVARDGLHGLHTHGHIVVRNRVADSVGEDVLRHLADHLDHAPPRAMPSKRI